jgi:alcohol dehydrogenase class IV
MVRWGLAELPGVLDELSISRPLLTHRSELAALAGPSRLRDYAVPREDLPELAQAIAQRPAAKSNPRPAPPDAVLELLEEIW